MVVVVGGGGGGGGRGAAVSSLKGTLLYNNECTIK